MQALLSGEPLQLVLGEDPQVTALFDAMSAETRAFLRERGVTSFAQVGTTLVSGSLTRAQYEVKDALCIIETMAFFARSRSLDPTPRPVPAALSTRARNALGRAGASPGQAIGPSVLARALTERGVGEKTQAEIRQFSEGWGVSPKLVLAVRFSAWDTDEIRQRLACRSIVSGVRALESLDRLVESQYATLGNRVLREEARGLIPESPPDQWATAIGLPEDAVSWAGVADLLTRRDGRTREVLEGLVSRDFGFTTVDDEMADVWEHLTSREKRVLRERSVFGQDRTLEEVGIGLRVTRERVRQIQKKARDRLNSVFAAAPRLRSHAAMERIAAEGLVVQEQIAAALRSVGLLRDDDALRDLLITWDCTERRDSLDDIVGFKKRGLTAAQLELEGAIGGQVRKLINQMGGVYLSQLADGGVDEDDCRAVLGDLGCETLPDGLWVMDAGESIPFVVARKMLAACGPLPVQAIRRGLQRHQLRLHYPVHTTEVLLALFATRQDLFELCEDGLLALRVSEPVVVAQSESLWLGLVQDDGPVVHRDLIVGTFMNAGLAAVTAEALIRYSELCEKVGRSLYALPGADVDSYDISDAQRNAIHIDAGHEFRYELDGSCRLDITAQQYLIFNGSLATGPAANLSGKWPALVDGQRVCEFSVGVPWMYGLGPVRDALSIEMGDRLSISFDLWVHEASFKVIGRVGDDAPDV